MEHKIYVGNYVKDQINYFFHQNILYCGMPNEKTFVLATYNGASTSPNVYYNITSTKIELLGTKIDVRQVTPEYIKIYIPKD